MTQRTNETARSNSLAALSPAGDIALSSEHRVLLPGLAFIAEKLHVLARAERLVATRFEPEKRVTAFMSLAGHYKELKDESGFARCVDSAWTLISKKPDVGSGLDSRVVSEFISRCLTLGLLARAKAALVMYSGDGVNETSTADVTKGVALAFEKAGKRKDALELYKQALAAQWKKSPKLERRIAKLERDIELSAMTPSQRKRFRVRSLSRRILGHEVLAEDASTRRKPALYQKLAKLQLQADRPADARRSLVLARTFALQVTPPDKELLVAIMQQQATSGFHLDASKTMRVLPEMGEQDLEKLAPILKNFAAHLSSRQMNSLVSFLASKGFARTAANILTEAKCAGPALTSRIREFEAAPMGLMGGSLESFCKTLGLALSSSEARLHKRARSVASHAIDTLLKAAPEDTATAARRLPEIAVVLARGDSKALAYKALEKAQTLASSATEPFTEEQTRWFHESLAKAWVHLGEISKAKDHLNKSLEGNELDAYSLNQFMDVALAAGQPILAEEALRQAIASHHSVDISWLTKCSQRFIALGRVDEGRAFSERATKLALGAYLEKGKWDESVFALLKSEVELLAPSGRALSEASDWNAYIAGWNSASKSEQEQIISAFSYGVPEIYKERLLAKVPAERRPMMVAQWDNLQVRGADEAPREVFDRTKAGLLECLESPSAENSARVKVIIDTLQELNQKEAQDLLLEHATRLGRLAAERKWKHCHPATVRLIDAALGTKRLRAQELVAELVASPNTPQHLAHRGIDRLVELGYLSPDLKKWEQRVAHKVPALMLDEGIAFNAKELIRFLMARGITPSGEVLAFVTSPTWEAGALAQGKDTVAARLRSLQDLGATFEAMPSAPALIQSLAKDKQQAMAYYVLHIGKSRFNLINNYTFEKFFEVIEIASNLKVSERVLETFHKALCVAGHTPDAASAIIANLRNGAAPFASSAAQELATRIRLDVSDSAKLNAAHREAGGALGREQLGVCLRSSLYRRFLLAEHHESPHLRSLQSAKTLAERGQALVEIESSHPEYLERGIQYLDQRFAEMRRKLPFTATAREILTNVEVTVNSQELLERVEEKRTALIHAKNSILRALKGENPQLAALEKGLRQKRRALRALQEGLAHNPALQSRIEEVSREISALEENSSALGLSYIDERYANLDENARREAIAAEQQELVSIEEKEPALVFIALVMESVGAESITEDELSLLREISSHLSHPFEVLREISKLDTRARAISKEQEVHYRLIPKRDLVTMARFADSKICCFSSTNYDMQVAHNTPNKYWVAAILADPLSFVFEIQDVPESQESGSFLGRPVVQNLGFNFGMFGTDSEENLTIFLNGVYLSTGNDAQSSASVLSATETLLSRPMRAAWQAVATKHGGNIGSAISGYNPEAFEGTRLRALTDKRGHDPVLNVYDDLGTKVNQECTFKALRKKVPKEKSQ